MNQLIKDGDQLGPKDHAEAIAMFRMQVIGSLLARHFQSHGELATENRVTAEKPHRAPGSTMGRKFAGPTIERWYYANKRGGLEALPPRRRSDVGTLVS